MVFTLKSYSCFIFFVACCLQASFCEGVAGMDDAKGYELGRMSYQDEPESPETDLYEGSIKCPALAVNRLKSKKATGFRYHINYLLPDTEKNRYDELGWAFVVVANFPKEGKSISFRTNINDVMSIRRKPAAQTLKELPAAFPPRGIIVGKSGQSLGGGLINGDVNLLEPLAKTRNIFVHAILENYVTNIVKVNVQNGKSQTFNDLFVQNDYFQQMDYAALPSKLDQPGVAISLDKTSVPLTAAGDLPFHGICRIAKKDAACRKDDLLKGLCFTAVTAYTQKSLSVNGIESEVKADITEDGPDFLITFQGNLGKKFILTNDGPFPWFIHAAFFQYISNVVEVVVTP